MNRYKSLFLFCMLVLFVFATNLFLIGFFPFSTNLDHLNDGKNKSQNIRPTELDGMPVGPGPPAQYDQALLMIIDALRWDFANASQMAFANANACANIKIKVDIPTVTMPRIKSLTTGKLSTFVDVILNLGHIGHLQDSLLHRLQQQNKAIVFAGDSTWTSLFPNSFLRSTDNDAGFYVNDFYKGDLNVTAVLRSELAQTDWTLLILHYLGLDHIGHVEGSDSSRIQTKLMEMDSVIREIVEHGMKKKLLLVTGDHGMRNGGGHGGSTPEEIYTPLLCFKHNCSKAKSYQRNDEYQQIDLAPTLSILLGNDIPAPSMGCLIPELLDDLDYEQLLYVFYYNSLHMLQHAYHVYGQPVVESQTYYEWFGNAKWHHKKFLESQRNEKVFSAAYFEQAKLEYKRTCHEISSILSEKLVKFDYGFIVIGLLLAGLITIYTILFVLFEELHSMLIVNSLDSKKLSFSLLLAIALNIILQHGEYLQTSHLFSSICIFLGICITIFMIIDLLGICLPFLLLIRRPSYKRTLRMPLPLMGCFVFHTLSFGSSSFIEEEHNTWYYFAPSMLLFILLTNLYQKLLHNNQQQEMSEFLQKLWDLLWDWRSSIGMLLAMVVLRKLNSVGIKWSGMPDIGDWLNNGNNKLGLTAFMLMGLILLLVFIRDFTNPLQFVACILACLAIYCFRASTGAVLFFEKTNDYVNVMSLTLFWLCFVAVAVIRYYEFVFKKQKHAYGYDIKSYVIELLQTDLCCCLLLCALLHKPHNIVLLPGMLFTLQEAYKLCDILNNLAQSLYERSYGLVYKTVLTIFIAQMFYFCQGNTNSLASIDLNPGYIGQSAYNPVLVFIFVTLNTYTAPITAYIYLMLHMFSIRNDSLPQRQEKEQITNRILLSNTEKEFEFVVSLFTATTLLPVTVYLGLLVLFRYHLFIYSVFAPKAFYECFHVLVFFINFCITHLHLMCFE